MSAYPVEDELCLTPTDGPLNLLVRYPPSRAATIRTLTLDGCLIYGGKPPSNDDQSQGNFYLRGHFLSDHRWLSALAQVLPHFQNIQTLRLHKLRWGYIKKEARDLLPQFPRLVTVDLHDVDLWNTYQWFDFLDSIPRLSRLRMEDIDWEDTNHFPCRRESYAPLRLEHLRYCGRETGLPLLLEWVVGNRTDIVVRGLDIDCKTANIAPIIELLVKIAPGLESFEFKQQLHMPHSTVSSNINDRDDSTVTSNNDDRDDFSFDWLEAAKAHNKIGPDDDCDTGPQMPVGTVCARCARTVQTSRGQQDLAHGSTRQVNCVTAQPHLSLQDARRLQFPSFGALESISAELVWHPSASPLAIEMLCELVTDRTTKFTLDLQFNSFHDLLDVVWRPIVNSLTSVSIAATSRREGCCFFFQVYCAFHDDDEERTVQRIMGRLQKVCEGKLFDVSVLHCQRED
ncbi:hypothetical protein BKA93DRAFT_329642 [Sparassis latifolia]